MPDSSWERLLARWSSGSPGDPETPATLTFERIDGERVFEVRSADAGKPPAGRADGWVPFCFRCGYPATAPHPPDARYLLVVRAVATDADREDFRRWLAEEHGPRQTTIPGVRWLEAYEEEGTEHSFLNLWGIEDPAIADGETWVRVRESPWWRRVAHVPAGADRGVYRRRGELAVVRARSVDVVSPKWTGRGR
jgi:hypothetical protein